MLNVLASLHPAPTTLPPATMTTIGRFQVATYPFDPAVAQLAWQVTFDDAYSRLEALPQMFLEPDGSWFWTSPPGEARWQLEGNLYDAGPKLAYVDLKGICPRPTFEQFLACFGWPVTSLMLQVSRAGLFVKAEDFLEISESA